MYVNLILQDNASFIEKEMFIVAYRGNPNIETFFFETSITEISTLLEGPVILNTTVLGEVAIPSYAQNFCWFILSLNDTAFMMEQNGENCAPSVKS